MLPRWCIGVLVAALVAACGSDEDDTGDLTVAAASSVQDAIRACAPDVRASFAGSDELAAQIRQGVPVDVFVAANTALPAALAEEALLDEPVVVATNALVVAVPGDSGVRALTDLARPGADIAIGAEGVPVGDYTREVLSRLPTAQQRAILANVRSEEPDVKGVIGKLTQGAVDAGIVYATDVKAASGRLRAVAIPAGLEPDVAYGAAVVTASKRRAQAAEFVDGLTTGACADALRARGFGPPP